MDRCTKSDGGLAGCGCIRPARHTGMCKVRRLDGSDSSRPARAARRGAGPARQGHLRAALDALAASCEQVGQAVAELTTAYDVAMQALAAKARDLTDRNRTLLKSLVASRRDLQLLKDMGAGGDGADGG